MRATILLTIIFLFSCRKIAHEKPFFQPFGTNQEKSGYVDPAFKFNKYVPKHKEGEIFVKFKTQNKTALTKVNGRLKETYHSNVMKKFNEKPFDIVKVDNAELAVNELKKDENVEWVSLNYSEKILDYPNDPMYTGGQMYGMQAISAATAWNAGNLGSQEIFVGVADEGIHYFHEDLCGQIWNNPYDALDGIDNDGNGYIDDLHGWNFLNNTNQIFVPADFHGTHVSGTIGAIGNNGKGVVGVSPNVTIISLKFLQGWGYDDGAIRGLDYIIDLKQRHGINVKLTSNSWGGGGFNPALRDAINRAAQAGIMFIAAAGNSAHDNDTPEPNYPSSYDNNNIIAVAATQWDNTLVWFSNYGDTTVDIAAPGTGIMSTAPGQPVNGVVPSNYIAASGTSMATPHVAGALALYCVGNPNATIQQMRDAILNNSTHLTALDGKVAGGRFLNVSSFTFESPAAVSRPCPIEMQDLTPPTVPGNFRVTGTGTDYIDVAWELSTDSAGILDYIIQTENGARAWICPGNFTSLRLGGLPSNTTFYIWIFARDNSYNRSADSDTISGTTTPTSPDVTPPTIPTGLSTSNITENSMRLNWSPSSDNVGVLSYDGQWRSVGGAWILFNTTGTSYPISNLSSNTTYEFQVRAKDAAGNTSGWSNIGSGTTLNNPPPPPPPAYQVSSTLDANAIGTRVTLSWFIVTNGTVESIRLERKKGAGSYQIIQSSIPVNSVSTIDNTGNPGNYTYRIFVTLTQGVSSYSNEKSIQVKKK